MWLVQALTIGVDYQTFWSLTPKKLTPFVEAFKQKREHATEEFRAKANFAAWLQGVYIARAIAVNFSKTYLILIGQLHSRIRRKKRKREMQTPLNLNVGQKRLTSSFKIKSRNHVHKLLSVLKQEHDFGLLFLENKKAAHMVRSLSLRE